MIELRQGNVLNVSNAIIVHGCNCQGVMGAGIALEIKNTFPEVYDDYKKVEKTIGLKLGRAYPVKVGEDKWIVNALTQDNYSGHGRRMVSYDAVANCFEEVAAFAKMLNASTGRKLEIVFPQIGAGLGGGNWKIIETIIDETVSDDFVKAVYIFKPR